MEIKTLNEQIERLRELVRKCYVVIASKNGIVPAVGERTMSNLSAAIESVPSPNKVKVGGCGSNFINENCINENGEWENSSMIDFSECTSMNSMFMYGASRLKELDVSNWDTSKVTSFRYWFRYGGNIERIIGKLDVSAATDMYEMMWGTQNLREIDVSDWKFNEAITYAPAFYECSRLTFLDVSKWDVSMIKKFENMFNCLGSYYRQNTEIDAILDVSNFNMTNATSIKSMFGEQSGCRMLDFRKWELPNVTSVSNFMGFGSGHSNKLESIIGYETIDSVLANNTTALKGLKVGIALRDYSNLDRASLRAVINGLAEVETAQNLYIGSTLMAKLTEEDIAIATNKNWTLS